MSKSFHRHQYIYKTKQLNLGSGSSIMIGRSRAELGIGTSVCPRLSFEMWHMRHIQSEPNYYHLLRYMYINMKY